jgi:hypothetical protein
VPGPGFEQALNPRDDFLEPQPVFEDFAAVPADLTVLAIAALQIAPGEEDIADAAPAFAKATAGKLSAEDRLLAAMNANRADAEIGAGPAVAQFAVQAPRAAFPRAAGAVAQLFEWNHVFTISNRHRTPTYDVRPSRNRLARASEINSSAL